jgi:hypothetical protein
LNVTAILIVALAIAYDRGDCSEPDRYHKALVIEPDGQCRVEASPYCLLDPDSLERLFGDGPIITSVTFSDVLACRAFSNPCKGDTNFVATELWHHLNREYVPGTLRGTVVVIGTGDGGENTGLDSAQVDILLGLASFPRCYGERWFVELGKAALAIDGD